MQNQTFTEKIVYLLLNGDMPSEKGASAKESGLIILAQESGTPVCASYGSSLEMGKILCSIMEQSHSIRAVLASAVVAYAVGHPEDPCVAGLKDFIGDIHAK